ncbi:MAG: 50S ribosomal protein L24 [Actinomycetota bacterium]
MARIRKGDKVHVLTGKDAGRDGRVIAVMPDRDRVLVEGVNRVKRHEKIRPGGGRAGQQGGIVTKELPVHLSNVTLICGTCGPTRVGYQVNPDGSKSRICKKCEADI